MRRLDRDRDGKVSYEEFKENFYLEYMNSKNENQEAQANENDVNNRESRVLLN